MQILFGTQNADHVKIAKPRSEASFDVGGMPDFGMVDQLDDELIQGSEHHSRMTFGKQGENIHGFTTANEILDQPGETDPADGMSNGHIRNFGDPDLDILEQRRAKRREISARSYKKRVDEETQQRNQELEE